MFITVNQIYYKLHYHMSSIVTRQLSYIFNHVPVKFKRYPLEAQQFLSLKEPPKQLTDDQYKHLAVDDDTKNRIDSVISRYNELKDRNILIPNRIGDDEMKELIIKGFEPNEIKRYLYYLFVREFDHWRRERTLNKKHVRNEKTKEKDTNIKIGIFDRSDAIQYGYWRNTMFSRNFNQSYRLFAKNNLRNSILFGQNVVLDVSYDKYMNPLEVIAAAKQMSRIYGINSYRYMEPFNLHYCNCDVNDRVMTHFNGLVNYNRNNSLINIHKESYLQLFPNQRLIYLSPDSRNLMTELDPNAVYIIGAFVDKSENIPVSLRRAKSEGIEHMRFPIHHYVELSPGTKRELSFQGVFTILHELKLHGNWKVALINGLMDHSIKSVVDDDNDYDDVNDGVELQHSTI